MRQARFLAKEITDRGHPMLQGDAMNRNAAILIYQGMMAHIYWVEKNFIPDVCIISAHKEVEQFTHLLRPMYVQLGCSSE